MRPDDPSVLSPDERRQAIAAILARGVLRLLDQPSSTRISDPAESGESSENPLALPSDSRLSGHHG